MPPKDEPLLTLEEVVAYLRVHPRTVYRLVNSGELPAVRVGRQWRVRRSALDAYLERSARSRGQADPATNEAAPATPLRSGPRRVLVVDDDAEVRRLFGQTLVPPQFQVDAVPDGETALEHLEAGRYDLLIVDLQLPGTWGMRVVRTAKRLAPEVPVVVTSERSSKASAIDAVELGVKAYLAKPFHARQVLAVVEQVLGD